MNKNKKVNFNVAKKKQQQNNKGTTNQIQSNRRKFEEYIAKTDQIEQVENLPDEISPDQIIRYVNMARTQPKQFAQLLRGTLKYYIKDKQKKTPHLIASCIQGKKAVEQAIRFCQKQKPIHALIPNEGLMLSTLDHCMDLVRSNFLQHTGSDGLLPWDRIRRRGKMDDGGAENCDHVMWYSSDNYAQETVMRYIIDQGVPSRGHRENIFKTNYYYIGACMLKCPKTGYKHAMNFSTTVVTVQNSEYSNKNFNYKRRKNQKPVQKKQQLPQYYQRLQEQEQQKQQKYENPQKIQKLKPKPPQKNQQQIRLNDYPKKKQAERKIIINEALKKVQKQSPSIIYKYLPAQQNKKGNIFYNDQKYTNQSNKNIIQFQPPNQNSKKITIKFDPNQQQYSFSPSTNPSKSYKHFTDDHNLNEIINKQLNKKQARTQHFRLIDLENQQYQKMWEKINMNNGPNANVNMKSNTYLLINQDILGGNISYNFGNKSKEVVSTTTKTKTMTVNGIKKTEISKTILYGDGTTETVTKLV